LGDKVEYIAEAVHQKGLEFVVATGGHTLTTDYPLAADADGTGPRPLEMLLASLASCAGGALMVLLRRGGQEVQGLRVSARGRRRTEHPTVFTEIALDFVVSGPVDPAAVARALAESEGRICPVWAMLRPSTPIHSSFRVEP